MKFLNPWPQPNPSTIDHHRYLFGTQEITLNNPLVTVPFCHTNDIFWCFDEFNETGFLNENLNNSDLSIPLKKKDGDGSSSTYWIKGQWTFEEDRKLMELVEQYGFKKWAQVAQHMEGRIGKQCRERWQNHLRPDIKKDHWSEEEERVLIEVHERVGNKWAEIAKYLPGRTENTIKNHWNATKRKQTSKRKIKKPASLNGIEQSMVLEEYIKKKYFNNGSSSSNSVNSSNSTLPEKTPFVPENSLSSSQDDSISYLTFETYEEEVNFMANLFRNSSQNNNLVPNMEQNDSEHYLCSSMLAGSFGKVESDQARAMEMDSDKMV